MNISQRENFKAFWPDSIEWDVPMAPYSTIRAGGQAEAMVTVETERNLSTLLKWLTDNAVSWEIIGRGSNIMVGEKGFNGVIILLGKSFRSLTAISDSTEVATRVQAGGGGSLAALLNWSIDNSLTGMEFTVGIPGSIGGAASMNAGAWEKSMGDVIHSLTVVDSHGDIHTVKREQLVFSYRRMHYITDDLKKGIITGLCLQLSTGDQESIKKRCKSYLQKRKTRQPQGMPSVGSFFKNPADDYAGRLIETTGLKGLTCGAAMVSNEHANFIINTGKATAGDITRLAQEVQQRVFQSTGVHLEPEVHILEQ